MKNQKSKGGKYLAPKKTLKWRKQFVLLVSVVVLILGAVGGTVAYLVAEGGQVTNQFEYGKVSCVINEPGWEDGNTVKKNVTVENTGNVSAYIRAAIVVTWTDASGNVYPQQPVSGTDYTLKLGSWTENGGYYYWPSVVPAEDSSSATDETGDLIESCTPMEGRAPDGYTLHVEILADAVQADPFTSYENAWDTVTGGAG